MQFVQHMNVAIRSREVSLSLSVTLGKILGMTALPEWQFNCRHCSVRIELLQLLLSGFLFAKLKFEVFSEYLKASPLLLALRTAASPLNILEYVSVVLECL